MSDVQVFKLVTGEEIIASVKGDDDDWYWLDRIRVLTVQPNQDKPGSLVLVMYPWMFSKPDGKFKLMKSQVVSTPNEDLPKELLDMYVRETTGLQITSSMEELKK